MRAAFGILVLLALLAAASPAHAGQVVEEQCIYEGSQPRAQLTQGTPPAALVDVLGVLRRPRTAADFLPDFGEDSALDRLDLRFVRRTPGEVGADQHYIVTGNFARIPSRPPRQCLRGLDARTRRALIREWRHFARQPTDALCLLEYQGDGMKLQELCVPDPVDALRRGLVLGPKRVRGRLVQVTGIVPDGVAGVEARYRSGPPRTARVVDNVWALIDLRRADRLEPETLVWLDASGAPVKSLDFSEISFRR